MKKVVILFGKEKKGKRKNNINRKYKACYEFFYWLCERKGIKAYRASYSWYNYKKNVFEYAWSFEKNNGWRKNKNVKPDLVYDKARNSPEAFLKKSLIAEKNKFLNNLFFSKLIDNKIYCNVLFSNWKKRSFLISNENDFFEKLRKMKTTRVVIKPVVGSGGKGIVIKKKNDLSRKDFLRFRGNLAEEFVDSSAGIPGIMKGMHDLRLVFINRLLIYAYFRRPAQGKLLANLAQGGVMEIVRKNKLPSSINPLIREIKNKLTAFGNRIYTVDLMFDKNKRPWIIELNSKPGIFFEKNQRRQRDLFYNKLIDVFWDEIKQK